MASLDDLATFFGWCTAFHVALYAASAFALLLARAPIQRLHSRLAGLPEAELAGLYFRWLGQYKLLILVFALVPWLALRAMA